MAGAAQDLSPLLGIPVATLTKELTGTAKYRILQKNVTPLNWRKISQLGINGILSEATSDRVYPTSTAAASLVGFVQADGSAGGGLEVLMDKALRGKSGKTISEQSQDGRPIPNGRQETIKPGPRARGAAHHRLRPAVVRPERRRPEGHRDPGAVGHGRRRERQDRRAAGCRVLPDVRPEPAGAVQRELDQQGVQRRLRARLHGQGDDGRRGARGRRGHPVDRRRGPQPDPPGRQQGVQGQPRPPDRVPHLRRGPRAVQQHRHHPRGREGQGADDVRLLHQVRSGPDVGDGFPRRGPRPADQRQGLERLAALHRALRPGPVGQRTPGRRGVPDDRQRRRPHPAADRRGDRGRQGRVHGSAARPTR